MLYRWMPLSLSYTETSVNSNSASFELSENAFTRPSYIMLFSSSRTVTHSMEMWFILLIPFRAARILLLIVLLWEKSRHPVGCKTSGKSKSERRTGVVRG